MKQRKYIFSSGGHCLGYKEVVLWKERMKQVFWISGIICMVAFIFLACGSLKQYRFTHDTVVSELQSIRR